MSLLDEIKRMKQEGKNEQEVIQSLQQRGISRAEIENALSQTQIKEAVTATNSSFDSSGPERTGYDFEGEGKIPSRDFNSLQPSLMTSLDDNAQDNLIVPVPKPSEEGTGNYQQEEYPQDSSPQEGYAQEGYQEQSYPQEEYASQERYPAENYPEQGYENQQYSQYPQSSVSTDTITEIAEQIVTEKLSKIRGQLEKATDIKGTAEGKLSQLDERLQRIEKIIDRLQLSVLQKIGDYVADVSDLKKELIETQKSFKAISGGHSHLHPSEGVHVQHHEHIHHAPHHKKHNPKK